MLALLVFVHSSLFVCSEKRRREARKIGTRYKSEALKLQAGLLRCFDDSSENCCKNKKERRARKWALIKDNVCGIAEFMDRSGSHWLGKGTERRRIITNHLSWVNGNAEWEIDFPVIAPPLGSVNFIARKGWTGKCLFWAARATSGNIFKNESDRESSLNFFKVSEENQMFESMWAPLALSHFTSPTTATRLESLEHPKQSQGSHWRKAKKKIKTLSWRQKAASEAVKTS